MTEKGVMNHPTLARWYASKAASKADKAIGLPQFSWQRNYYEHVLRNDESLALAREYIINNPLNWHLDKPNVDMPPG